MTRSRISVLLITSAALALAACSGTQGPGKIGSKDDIVIRNKNMPGQTQAAQGGDFSTTVEQGEAVPAPEVAMAEHLAPPAQSQPLPDNSPAMQQAVAAHDAARAAPQTVETPPDASRAAVAENKAIDTVAPATPVNAPAPVPPPAASALVQTPAQPVQQQYVATQSAPAQAVTAPAPVAPSPEIAASAPNPDVHNMPYPLDPNAPYSPRKIAEAQAKASTPHAPATAPALPAAGNTAAPAMDASDPSMIRAAQAALAVKGAYAGPQTGIIDADFLNALTKYQGANGLPMGGLNEATLRQLGLIE